MNMRLKTYGVLPRGKKMLLTSGCGRRIARGFWAISSTGRALGAAWRDII